jgi:DNA-binding transcriptional LysR family regulator
MSLDILYAMQVFATVVDRMSFAKAADKLDLSRGMTSRYVAQLEEHLGTRLLNRTTRRLSLTEAGHAYHQRAIQVLALVEEAGQFAAMDLARPRGTLRVSTSMAFGATHFGKLVREYLRRYPEVKVDVTLDDRVVDLIEEGIDMAVRIATRIDPGLVARPITQARIVACAAPAYLKAHGTPLQPADLAQHNCLTYGSTLHPGEWQFSHKGKGMKIKVSGDLRSNNGNILCDSAAAGLGVILQPTFLVHELLRTRRLVRILRDWEPEPLTIFAVYPNREFLPPKVRSMIDFLVESLGTTPYWDIGIE